MKCRIFLAMTSTKFLFDIGAQQNERGAQYNTNVKIFAPHAVALEPYRFVACFLAFGAQRRDNSKIRNSLYMRDIIYVCVTT